MYLKRWSAWRHSELGFAFWWGRMWVSCVNCPKKTWQTLSEWLHLPITRKCLVQISCHACVVIARMTPKVLPIPLASHPIVAVPNSNPPHDAMAQTQCTHTIPLHAISVVSLSISPHHPRWNLTPKHWPVLYRISGKLLVSFWKRRILGWQKELPEQQKIVLECLCQMNGAWGFKELAGMMNRHKRWKMPCRKGIDGIDGIYKCVMMCNDVYVYHCISMQLIAAIHTHISRRDAQYILRDA